MTIFPNNQSIIVFCPRAGLSLQTHHVAFTLFSAFLFVSSYSPFIIILSIIWFLFCLELYSFTIPSSASFSRQFLLSQWPSQFLFLFFTSSTIILPSHSFQHNWFFLLCLSILHAPSFSISTSQMLSVFFAHSVVVSKSLHHTTLRYTPNKALH